MPYGMIGVGSICHHRQSTAPGRCRERDVAMDLWAESDRVAAIPRLISARVAEGIVSHESAMRNAESAADVMYRLQHVLRGCLAQEDVLRCGDQRILHGSDSFEQIRWCGPEAGSCKLNEAIWTRGGFEMTCKVRHAVVGFILR